MTDPPEHDGVDVVYRNWLAAPATTVTEVEPLIVPSVADKVAVAALYSVIDGVPIPTRERDRLDVSVRGIGRHAVRRRSQARAE